MPTIRSTKIVVLTVASLALLVPRATLGQGSATAERLLQEGKSQVAAGDLEAGCASFSKALEAQKHPRIRINLADCREKQGRLATAWAEYIEVKRMSRELSEKEPSEQKRLAYVEEKIKALEPRLSFLLVTVEVKVPGLELSRDGAVLPDGAKIPIDPGQYTLQARAPGFVSWSQSVKVQGEGTTQSVSIPALKPLPGAEPATPTSASAVPTAPPPASRSASPPPLPSNPGRSRVGWVLGGVGVVASGVGLFFGNKAFSSYDEAETQCPTRRACSPTAMGLRNKADTQATVANIAVGGGLLALGAGAYLLLSKPSSTQQGRMWRGSPWATNSGAGIFWQEQF